MYFLSMLTTPHPTLLFWIKCTLNDQISDVAKCKLSMHLYMRYVSDRIPEMIRNTVLTNGIL